MQMLRRYVNAKEEYKEIKQREGAKSIEEELPPILTGMRTIYAAKIV